MSHGPIFAAGEPPELLVLVGTAIPHPPAPPLPVAPPVAVEPPVAVSPPVPVPLEPPDPVEAPELSAQPQKTPKIATSEISFRKVRVLIGEYSSLVPSDGTLLRKVPPARAPTFRT